MTAKERVLEQAPGWSEKQAERALLAAEGSRSGRPENQADVLKRAAALRARQRKTADAATLAREARDELDRRPS